MSKTAPDLFTRVPPQNLEAERAVLGGVFLKDNLFPELLEVLSEDDFYSPANRMIFSAFLALYQRNVPIDLVTVAEHLNHIGKLGDIGGAVYLAELAQSEISAANALYYANIVRDKAMQRGLINAATGIITSCFEPGAEVPQLMDQSEQAVFNLSQRLTTQTYRSSRELVSRMFDELAKRVEHKALVTGVPTGYHRLNELTAGFQPSDLVIIAARPSMGKTAFALNLAMRAACDHGVPTLVFSLEMSMDQLIQRMLCARKHVDLSSVRRGTLSDLDWQGLYAAAEDLSAAPIYIDDTPSLGTLDMRARSRRLAKDKGVGLIVVDYLQLMRASRRIDSREQEISEISRSLKALAKELNVPVLALSQLNRKVEERSDKKPVLSDLRESGAIEQDADLILFLYRDEVYNKHSQKKGTAEVIIGKQRNGPLGELTLTFINNSTAFEEYAGMEAMPSEALGPSL